jgi:hypothetical protein
MTSFQRAILALAVVALLLAAWMGRYSLAGDLRSRMMLDRWTGKVFIPALSEQ